MQKLVDRLDNLTGWSGDLVFGLSTTGFENFVAGINNQSTNKALVLNVPANSENKFIEKSITFDFTEFDELVFNVQSVNKGRGIFRKTEDFSYKIEFKSGTEHFINASNELNDITISLPSFNNLDKIKITVLHNDADIMVISNLIAVKTELPLDLFVSLKEQLDFDLSNKFGNGILLGGVTASAGAREIQLTGELPFLDEHSKIRIVGINTEEHIVEDYFGSSLSHPWHGCRQTSMFAPGKVVLGNLFDGNTLLFNHTASDVFLVIESLFGSHSKEAVIPSSLMTSIESRFMKTSKP